MKGQSKLASFVEANCNSFIGYWVSVLVGVHLYPLFDLHMDLSTNMMITASFVIVSTLRSFVMRRIFNWWSER